MLQPLQYNLISYFTCLSVLGRGEVLASWALDRLSFRDLLGGDIDDMRWS